MTTIAVPFFMGDPMPGFAVPEPHKILDPALPDADPQQRMAVLYAELADWVAQAEDPVAYSGDCVSTIGVLAGLQRRGIRPTLLFFDAHGDFHTWETSQSGFIGGMPLAMLTGRGEQTIVAGAGLTPLPDDRVVLIDGRALTPARTRPSPQPGSVINPSPGWPATSRTVLCTCTLTAMWLTRPTCRR